MALSGVRLILEQAEMCMWERKSRMRFSLIFLMNGSPCRSWSQARRDRAESPSVYSSSKGTKDHLWGQDARAASWGKETFKLLTNSVQPVESHRFKSSPHHGILFQHLIEVVHWEGVEPAVGVRSHAGCAPAASQQTDFWNERASLRTRGQRPSTPRDKSWHSCSAAPSATQSPLELDSTSFPFAESRNSRNVLHTQ